MARRRMISAELLADEHFNLISLEAQNIFIRMLTISDDCGVVPTNTYRLNTLINTPLSLRENIQDLIDEIVLAGMGLRFEYDGGEYFAFKAKSFEEYQSYILNKARKSEYLRIPKDEYTELSKTFLEFPRNSWSGTEKRSCAVESRKKRVESSKQKAEREDRAEKKQFAEFVLMTDDEYSRLVTRVGTEDFANRCVAKLDAYLGQSEKNRKKYSSHYHAILNWVIEKVKTEGTNGTTDRGGYRKTGPGGETTGDDLRRTNELTKRRLAAEGEQGFT